MVRYAIFLRGINIGGIKVPMSELRDCLEKLGLNEVKTYLQTGNVTLSSDTSQTKLKKEIEAALAKTFSYQAYVLVYKHPQLKEIVDGYPLPVASQPTVTLCLAKSRLLLKNWPAKRKA